MAGKAALFLDAGYLDKLLELHGRLRIDYERFSDALCEPEERFRTYYYNCPPWQGNPPSDEDRTRLSSYQAFAHRLNLLNRFVVREGRLQKIGDRFRQKGVDMLLAVDLLRLASGVPVHEDQIPWIFERIPWTRRLPVDGVWTAG